MTDSKKLKENRPQFFCEYCEHTYSLEECGKPATHHYFPVPYCGASFLCDRHAARLRKLDCEIIKNSQDGEAAEGIRNEIAHE